MKKIMLWEPDLDLRKALTLYINRLGYKAVALNRFLEFKNAIELERPLLCLLPTEMCKGSRIKLDDIKCRPGYKGEMTVVLPLFEGDSYSGDAATGIVVDRLRKPFGIQELASRLDAALARREELECYPGTWEQSLEIRALRNFSELRQALELRYEVYREVGYMEASEYGLDLDPFDFKSTIFGAFITGSGHSELAGTIRIIQQKGFGPHRKQVAEIMGQYGIDPAAAELSALSPTLPALQTFRLQAADCRGLYPGFATETSVGVEPVCSQAHELSRLVIGSKHRRNRAGMERRLYEMVIAHCCAQEPMRNWFVIAVHPSKTRKYVRFGFQNISQLGIKAYTGIDQPAALMVWDLQRYLRMPNPFTTLLDENIVEYNYRNALVSPFHDRTVVRAGEVESRAELAV